MLGVIDNFVFREKIVEFPPGSALVVFSDGVTEAMNEEEGMFGEARVRDAVLRSADRSADEIRNNLLAELRAFVGTARQSDDITVLIAKRL